MNVPLRRLAAAMLSGLLIGLMTLSTALAQGEDAAVRLIHAVPGGPAVDVYIDGVSVAEGVSFFTAGDYLALPAGDHQLQVAPAGAGPASAVISTTLSLAAGQAYTVMATGTADSIQPAVLQDNREPPVAGETKIRFIHAVPAAPAVDIRRVGAEAPLVNNLAFREASDYLPLVPGSYDFNVVATGQTEVLYSFDQDLVATEPIYDIFLVGALPDIRAEVVGAAASGAAPAPAIDGTATAAPTDTPQATAQPTATQAATQAATAQPAATQAPTQAAGGQATAQPTASAATATPPPVSQLPNTGGPDSAPLTLAALGLAALLIGGGLLLWRQGRSG